MLLSNHFACITEILGPAANEDGDLVFVPCEGLCILQLLREMKGIHPSVGTRAFSYPQAPYYA